MKRDDIIQHLLQAADETKTLITNEPNWPLLMRFAALVAAEKQEENDRLKRENSVLRSELKHRISSDILFTETDRDMTKEEADAQAEKEITWMVLHNEGAE